MSEKQYAAMLKFCCKTKFRKETLLRFCKKNPVVIDGNLRMFYCLLAFTRDTKIVFLLQYLLLT